jgi:signal transduction histidine kinase
VGNAIKCNRQCKIEITGAANLSQLKGSLLADHKSLRHMTGIGIPQSYIKNIFYAFYRLKQIQHDLSKE